jgi:hypothetical protein
VIAALLFVVNWKGHHTVFNRAMRKRFGHWGLLMDWSISICAFAALAKPFTYAGLRVFGASVWGQLLLETAVLIDWLSFLFEYLFGVCIQVYLILLAYVWVRGMKFTHGHLLDFAIRRFSLVARWALVVMALSTLLIHLPLILSVIPLTAEMLPTSAVVYYIDGFSRPTLAVFLLLFPAMQITLTFHSESLRQALRHHFRFVAQNFWLLAWFVLLAALHFYCINTLNTGILQGKGEGTAIAIVWQLLYPVLQALVAGWLLASWVCLYKRCEHDKVLDEDWIKF